MNIRARLPAEETRSRIIDVAEEHFRRIGYAKTAVADIAAALKMSPANIYRFFPSKSAINDAICRRLLAECDAMIDAIVAGPGPADERLRRLICDLHDFNKSRYTTDRRIHDMVEVAMQEHWEAIAAHLAHTVAAFGRLVADGQATGLFRPGDSQKAALTIKHACACVLHPMLIAESACRLPELEDAPAELADFIIRALRA